LSTIWICRLNQLHTLRQFAPLVDRVVINPFVVKSQTGPKYGDSIWLNFDHPFINNIRQIRQNSDNKKLLGCIDLRGEPSYFGERRASLEEIKWMLYALVGGNFQGIVYRQSVPWPNRIRQLAAGLKKYADDLGQTQSVRWLTASQGQPVSAIKSPQMLFVVLLNPEYMKFSQDGRNIILPLESPKCQGLLELRPPENTDIISASTISGRSLALEHNDEGFRVKFNFVGSGEILIFSLSCNYDKNTGETANKP